MMQIEDVALVEFGPKFESKQAHLVVRHIKFGTGKKGGKKDKTVASPKIENADSAHVDSHDEEQHDQESGSDDDDEVEAPSQSVTAVSSADNFYSDTKGDSFVANPTASTILQETENRYARNAPKNPSAVSNPMRTLDSATQILGQPYGIPPPHHRVPPRNGEMESPSRSVSATANPGQSINSDMKGANFVANPTASATSQGTENRYARSAPNNPSAVRNPVRTLDNAPQISGQPFAHSHNRVLPRNFPQQNHPSVLHRTIINKVYVKAPHQEIFLFLHMIFVSLGVRLQLNQVRLIVTCQAPQDCISHLVMLVVLHHSQQSLVFLVIRRLTISIQIVPVLPILQEFPVLEWLLIT